jgi:peptidoglycan hydrolase-like protein with peptidoglycan-binding domain
MKKIIGYIFALILVFTTSTALAAESYFVPLDDQDPSVENVTCADLGLGTKLLKKGSVGTAVFVLQDILMEYGYYEEYESTGIYDSATISAVKSMQADLDVKADGVVGPITRAAMQDICLDFVSGS